ncbi:transcription factor Gf.BMR1 [Sparassis crispa]|uniref:Transcription factor Gf.BMR1 n=1 Tax=Sparassis crispa TaxID=139825 RepID=A0A401H6G5_9APHY|nr:transcription factor Gf.BMR1 [Sparassis crispa]GBE90036.1 transcription factor Gf.BMR1 [Sparassis crispa]
MAGDHKCPVCQSTFTRPQHVARHMRSHTGDRPYKCLHCGDQFARSDLLSRHVNKCHAGAKPPTTTAPSRRKGPAAASRATTSKQACDQCVQSSLPCDGSNPCSKCVQRKCRCTYVKFHRQTAPQGPGHPVPTTSALPGRPQPSLDDFVLAPPPPPPPPSSHFTFPSAYPPPEYLAQPGPSLYPAQTYSTRESPAPSAEGSPDLMARYQAQAQAELFGHGAMGMPAPAPAPAPADALPGMFDPQGVQFGRYALPVAPAWPAYHVAEKPPPPAQSQYEQSFRDGGEAIPAHPPAQHAHGHAYRGRARAHVFGGIDGYAGAREREGSDGGYEGSIASSRNSSSVHLPLPEHAHQGQQQQQQQQRYEEYRVRADGAGEGGFSSAFGLMSLDDPNVLAGLAGDASPFFAALPGAHPSQHANPNQNQNQGQSQSQSQSQNGGGMATPDFLAALKSGGPREDNKEMRDFWKMYMRTPPTGPGPGPGLGNANANANGNANGNGASVLALATPTGAVRRHSRVASLPSMKTPPEPGYAGHGHGHGGEDLTSYEEAVLARRAPMTLNLVPKRKMTAPAAAGFGAGGRSVSAGAGAPLVNGGSALANVFVGDGQQGYGVGSHVRGQAPLPPPPHQQSEAGEADGVPAYRPSFKRLASQTLGPECAKRALLGPAGWDDEDEGDDGGGEEDGEDEMEVVGGEERRHGSGGAKMRRPMVSIAERRRRMSCPTGAEGGPPLQPQRMKIGRLGGGAGWGWEPEIDLAVGLDPGPLACGVGVCVYVGPRDRVE